MNSQQWYAIIIIYLNHVANIGNVCKFYFYDLFSLLEAF